MEFQLHTLSPEDIRGHWTSLQAIAADVPGEYWTEENFLVDLPDKWRLSFAAWSGAKPVAYAILSRRSADRVYLHHFMVTAPLRGQGLGSMMIEEMERRSLALGCSRLALKVARDNAGAQRLYFRLGYASGGHQGDYVVFDKGLS